MAKKLRWSGNASDFVEEYYLEDPDDTYGLFHVTPRLSEILRSGKLKSRKELGGVGTLGGGGGNIDSHMISVTYSGDRARFLLGEFIFMSRIANGEVSVSEVVQHIHDICSSYYEKIEDSVYEFFSNIALSGDEDTMYNELSLFQDEMPFDGILEIDGEDVRLNSIFNDHVIVTLAQNNHVCNSCDLDLPIEDLLESKNPCFVFDVYNTFEDLAQKLQGRYGSKEDEHLAFCTPGFTLGFKSIKDFKKNNIGILVLKAIVGSKTVFIEEEKELRFHPEDIEIMNVIELQ